MEHVLQQAAQAGCDAVWLGVWEHNPRALAFYRKWQFVPFVATFSVRRRSPDRFTLVAAARTLF
jgi:ribosomal protein S18 acetylase RimI-like enzyme